VTVVNHNTYVVNRYVPVNAHYGGSFARVETFGGRGAYQRLSVSQASYFSSGRRIGAPAGGSPLAAGPPGVRPTLAALTPARTYRREASVPDAVIRRPVVRTAVPDTIARTSIPIARAVTPPPATHTIVRDGSAGNRTD